MFTLLPGLPALEWELGIGLVDMAPWENCVGLKGRVHDLFSWELSASVLEVTLLLKGEVQYVCR